MSDQKDPGIREAFLATRHMLAADVRTTKNNLDVDTLYLKKPKHRLAAAVHHAYAKASNLNDRAETSRKKRIENRNRRASRVITQALRPVVTLRAV